MAINNLLKVFIGKTTIEVIRGDITLSETCAIVNAANKDLQPGGGVAGAIHSAAGNKLYEECKKIGYCETGDAKLTRGYDLLAQYVIHTVGPVYSSSPDDATALRSCYINSLLLAEKNVISSISFPAISTGIFGYPVNETAHVSLTAIKDYLKKDSSIELIRIVLYDYLSFEIFENIFKKVFV